MVNDWPAQTDPLLTEITGDANTVICAIAGRETHPSELVPVTVYEVLVVGDTALCPEEYV